MWLGSGWNWARVGSGVRMHLCKTGGEGVGVRARVRSRVGEERGDGPAVAMPAGGLDRSGKLGRGIWAGKGAGSEAGAVSWQAGVWDHGESWTITRSRLSPPPLRCPPRPQPLTHQRERAAGRGVLPAAAAPEDPTRPNGLRVADNIKLRPGRLTPSRRLRVRPRPLPAEPMAEPRGVAGRGGDRRGGASAPSCLITQTPRGFRRRGGRLPSGLLRAEGRRRGGARPHCSFPAKSASK